MSEDKTENLYYYSNKGRQQTFNLDDLTTEELKKFEKMTERQRLKFITNFELQRDTPFQDNISLKPIMTEARNEKYGDYALLKAKLDEIDSIANKDPNIAAKLNEYQVMTADGKRINEFFLPFFRNITEEDLKNCMKAFDMKNVSLGMLKKYYNRKIESLEMPGVKTSFLDALRKFYEKVLKLNPTKDEKAATESLGVKIAEIKTPEELNPENTEEYIKKCQELIKKTAKAVIQEVELGSSEKKQIIRYVDAFEIEKLQKALSGIANEQLNSLIKLYMQIESDGVDIITDKPSEEHKEKEVSEKSEALEETKEEPEIIAVEEEKEEEEKKEPATEVKPETTKEEPKPEEPKPEDLNTPSKLADANTEKQMIETLDRLLPTLNRVVSSFKKKNEPPGINGLIKEGKEESFGAKVYTYSDPFNDMKPKYIVRKNGDDIMFMYDNGNFLRHNLKEGWKMIGSLVQPLNKDSGALWKIEYRPNLNKATYIDPNHTHEITYTRYGKGYKIKYTSGSLIDKIRDKFLKSVNDSITDLKEEDKNLYSKLDSLEAQIRDLKSKLLNVETTPKRDIQKKDVPPPPSPFESHPIPSFLDEILKPHKPLKPVEKKEKPLKEEEYSDTLSSILKKQLDDRRKDIEYSSDDEDDIEWGEGIKSKKASTSEVTFNNRKRMEILDFLRSLD